MNAELPQGINLESQYDQRFIEDYLVSKMSSDVVTAMVELIANTWDAAAKVSRFSKLPVSAYGRT